MKLLMLEDGCIVNFGAEERKSSQTEPHSNMPKKTVAQHNPWLRLEATDFGVERPEQGAFMRTIVAGVTNGF